MVSDVPDQLPRSRADATGPRCRRGPYDPLPLDPGLCARAGEADPATSAYVQWLVAGRRDIRQGEGTLDVSLSGGGQPRSDDRLSVLGQAGCRGSQAVLP